MDIKETELPGIGRKFQVDIRAGERIVIIVRDDGNRQSTSLIRATTTRTLLR